MVERVTRFDPAEGLDTPEEVAAFWNAVLAEGDAALTSHALKLIAKARVLPVRWTERLTSKRSVAPCKRLASAFTPKPRDEASARER